MTDLRVIESLRGDAALVVIEAAAGCGKTHQGASYAAEVAGRLVTGRVLILTHTHAARSVFADRTKANAQRVDIRTLDGFLTEIASAYHTVLDLPLDVATWAIDADNGFAAVATKVADFLGKVPSVAQVLARRYPVIICDEHQDASEAQHDAIMQLMAAGAKIRIFGDPMQIIFAEGTGWRQKEAAIRRTTEQWRQLKHEGTTADLCHPHRWSLGSPDLGDWILRSRESLKEGGVIDVRGPLPKGLQVCFAENMAQVPLKALHFERSTREPIDRYVRNAAELLVLTVGNDRVQHISAFFSRRLRIWEGHRRDALTCLVKCIRESHADPVMVTDGMLDFIASVSTGFLASDATCVKQEILGGCIARRRGKPQHLQTMAQEVLLSPDHRGVSKALAHLVKLVRSGEPGFSGINLDLYSEIKDAISLGGFNDVDQGAREIAHRRTILQPRPFRRCVSTIHKSKGLECDNVLLMLCDKESFSSTEYKRRLLYVALSRARKTMTLVLSRQNPSPLFRS